MDNEIAISGTGIAGLAAAALWQQTATVYSSDHPHR